MSIATVLWILAVSGLVTGVAGAAASALRRLRRPERWVWIVALAVIATLPFLPAPSAVADTRVDVAATTRVIPIAQMVTFASASLPEPARVSVPWIPILWGAASVATVLAMLGGAWSLARRRERWPRRRIDGDLLRVSDRFGPAVVGWIEPEIVLPAWAVDLEARQRRLILRHENEHRWARDPQLLALGVLLLAAAPWNPFAWLQFRGLRRAVEFDCDARVLGSGASPRAYGRLLLSVQLDGGRGALFAPALREPASFLERRLQTMKLRDRPVARLRVAGLALVAVALAVVACETPRPTESEPVAERIAPAAVLAPAEQGAGIIRIAPTIFAERVSYPDDALVFRPRGEGAVEIARGGQAQMITLRAIEAAWMGHVRERPEATAIVEVALDATVADVDALQEAMKEAGIERVVVVHLRASQTKDDGREKRHRVEEFGVDDDAADRGRREQPVVDEGSILFRVEGNGAVHIHRSGQPLMQTVTIAEVADVWQHEAGENPALHAIVRPEETTPEGVVEEVLGELRAAGATRISMMVPAAGESDGPVPALAPDSARSGPVPGLRTRAGRDGPVPALRSRADTARPIELWRPDAQDSLRMFGDSVLSSVNSPIRPLGDSWRIEPDEDGQRPLIYVDEVRIEDDTRDEVLDRIRPQDIERIEVIKGSTAERLYGADAAGGVILIFTRKND